MKFASFSMGFAFVIYVWMMFSGLYTFGTSIQGDVLDSLGDISSWESFVLRSIFALIMLTHTPFVFFIGKESVLCLAVLIHLRFKNKQIEDEDWDEEPLLENPDFDINQDLKRKRSKSERKSMRQSMSRKRINDTVSRKNIETSISLAIPFYKRSMKSIVVDEDDQQMSNAPAYTLLPNKIYYPVTIGLFVMVVGSAWVIKDVESVIKYIGSLGNSILNFLIPGVCYFIIMGRYEEEKTSAFKRYCALGLAIYGGTLAIICTGVNVWTTFHPLKNEYD